MEPELSIVIPAYNEEERLSNTLPRLLAYLTARFGAGAWEVVVVDDGSSDGTAELVRSFQGRGVRALSLPANRGKGAAVRRGLLATRGSRVLMTDADLSTPIHELEALEPYLGEAEMVIGSRGLASSRITSRQPLYRELMGKTFNHLLHVLGVRGFRDTQCGFKLFDGEVARRLAGELTIDGFAFDVELVLLAQEHGYAVREVGVEWGHEPQSRVHPVVDSGRILWDVARLRWRRWSGSSRPGRTAAWGLVLLALAAFWVYRNAWVPATALAGQPADFSNYHRAATFLLAGESPYRVHNFDYPPLVAFAMAPLAAFPELAARRLWLAASLLSLLAAGVLTAVLLGGDRAAWGVVLATWAVAGTQAENLVLGQLHPLLLLLVVLSWWGWTRARSTAGPALAHGAVAAAAGLKLWPALLVAVPALRGGTARTRLRSMLAGAGAVVLAVALPWLALLAWPPPHTPASAGYWMGTPALLSFGLPSVAVRLASAGSEPEIGETPPGGAQADAARALPASWVHGHDPRALDLPRGQRLLSVGVAALTLLLGAGALWRAPGTARRGLAGRGLLHAAAALVALALLASPISWYHYQIFQLPGLALLAHRGWEGRRWGFLTALGAITLGLTWSHHWLVGEYLRRFGWTAAQPLWLWTASSMVAALGVVVFILHLRAMRRP